MCILALTLMLAACGGDLAEKLYGAWKSEKVGDNGKPTVVLFTKDTLNMNGKVTNVVYKSIAVSLDISDAASQKTIIMATNIEKNDVMFTGDAFDGKVKFLRISEDEAKSILAQ